MCLMCVRAGELVIGLPDTLSPIGGRGVPSQSGRRRIVGSDPKTCG